MESGGLPRWVTHSTSIGSTAVAVDRMKEWLSPEMRAHLQKAMSLKELFAVQRSVIPTIRAPYLHCDVCVCAPTGSGKTLAYAIPIVDEVQAHLQHQRVCRALVMVPSKPLADQVYRVFKELVASFPVTVRSLLESDSTTVDEACATTAPKHVEVESSTRWGDDLDSASLEDAHILIATPGVLLDYISRHGHRLQHLKWLVLDEADKLLMQSYGNWLPAVLSAADYVSNDSSSLVTDRSTTPLHKLLFSATLTHNPEKMSSLRLSYPRYFKHSGRLKYSPPTTLQEHVVMSEPDVKPLVLFLLLQEKQFKQVLCFTNSVDSAHRLYVLFQLMNFENVVEYSSRLRKKERSVVLSGITDGTARLVICTDAMARGMDIDTIDCVVNYDMAQHIKTYIHRVGRTARANRQGDAFSMIDIDQMEEFQEIRAKATQHDVIDVIEPPPPPHDAMERYQDALRQLKYQLKREEKGIYKRARSEDDKGEKKSASKRQKTS